MRHIVAKNPHSPELRAQRGESEYIDSRHYKDRTYEQGKALRKRLDEIEQEMADNQVNLMDLFRPYQP